MKSIAKALLAGAAAAMLPAGPMTDAAIQRAPARPHQRPRPKAPWQVWRDTAGRLSLAAHRRACLPVRAARHRDLRFQLQSGGGRRAPAQQRHPPHRLLGADLPDDVARHHAAAADRPLQPACRCAAHDRRRRLHLCRLPHQPLRRRPDVRPLEGRKRDRAAALPHHRVHGAARSRRARHHLDRRHGAPAGRQAMAAPAQHHLRHRAPGSDPLLPADQGG